ncbi:MAG: LamG-like jellyroll fold domain-containing protein [Armatimonadota bacterium]
MRQSPTFIVAILAFALLATASYGSLVGYWKFDEGTGQTCADSSGNGNNGTLGSDSSVQTEDPTWGTSSEAKAGDSCVILDHNQKDWVSVPDSDSLDIAGSGAKIHIQAWIFPFLVGSDAVDYPVQIIVWKGSFSSSGACNYSLDMHTTGGNTFIRFGFRDSGNTWQYLDSTAQILDSGQWYFVSVDYDSGLGENNCRICVDSTCSTGTIFLETTTMVANTDPLRIGRRSASSFPLNGFHGRIDNLVIRNDYQATGVMVSDLRAVRQGPFTRIEWTCPTTLSLFGFDVLGRIPGREAWQRLNRQPILADGPPLQPRKFAFADRVPGAVRSYRLEAVYRNGERRAFPVPVAKSHD